jgi:hypothetical protein
MRRRLSRDRNEQKKQEGEDEGDGRKKVRHIIWQYAQKGSNTATTILKGTNRKRKTTSKLTSVEQGPARPKVGKDGEHDADSRRAEVVLQETQLDEHHHHNEVVEQLEESLLVRLFQTQRGPVQRDHQQVSFSNRPHVVALVFVRMVCHFGFG